MRIIDNVEMLEIAAPQGVMYLVLTWDDKDVILFDTGLPGQLELIRAAVEKTGHSLEQVTKVILTHHDIDHIGCAKPMKEFGAKIMAPQKETPYIQGDEVSPKIRQREAHLNELSEEERAFYERIKSLSPYIQVEVDEIVHDGESLPFCGGIEVVGTPGHTPGHTAFFLKDSKVLITGDAANIADGELIGPNPKHTLDMPEAEESFEKLKRINAGLVVCYHTGLLSKK